MSDALIIDIELDLIRPVEFNGQTIATLKLSEPSIGQLRKANKAGDAIDQLAALISLNAKIPQAAVDMLCQRDMEACADFFGRFGGSPTTSGT